VFNLPIYWQGPVHAQFLLLSRLTENTYSLFKLGDCKLIFEWCRKIFWQANILYIAFFSSFYTECMIAGFGTIYNFYTSAMYIVQRYGFFSYKMLQIFSKKGHFYKDFLFLGIWAFFYISCTDYNYINEILVASTNHRSLVTYTLQFKNSLAKRKWKRSCQLLKVLLLFTKRTMISSRLWYNILQLNLILEDCPVWPTMTCG
jgi:hypothetical protein